MIPANVLMFDLPDDLHDRANQLLDFCPAENWNVNAFHFLKQVLPQDGSIGIACSGGSDSTFALLLVFSAFPKFSSRLSILHYNHGLRGNASNADETLVRGLAEKLGLKCFVEYPNEKQTKLDENSLRELRLKFFCRVQHEYDIKAIVQGHHLDDIAETLLWRIPRGVSVDGLISPKPISSLGDLIFVRPFLSFSKVQIRESLKKCLIPWREDSSNRENTYLRNKTRNLVVPIWKKSLDRDLLKGLSSTRKLLEQDSQALDYHAMKGFEKCVSGQELNFSMLRNLPIATQRRVLGIWIKKSFLENANFTKCSINFGQLTEIINHERFKSVQLSENCILKRKNGILELSEVQSITPLPNISVPANSIVFLPNGGKIGVARVEFSRKLSNFIFQRKVNQSHHAYISDRFGVESLFVRSRNRGETYHPMGAPGTKKLADWMIDRKWTDVQKAQTPVFLNSNDHIVWVPGFPPAEFAKVSKSGTSVIHLTYEHSDTL